MTYVIRSMTTTDLPECRPYHIYLMKPEKRIGAYWCPYLGPDIQEFSTAEEAEAEAQRLKLSGKQVVPRDASHLPPFWEWQEEQSRLKREVR